MNKQKTITSLIIIALVFGVCTCAAGADISDAGESILLSMESEGYSADTNDADMTSVLKQESNLFRLSESLNPDEGVHLNYDLHVEKMKTDTIYDVHYKNGIFYSRHVLPGDMYSENGTITFFEDGNVYTLNEQNKTGVLATTTDSEFIRQNVIMMDDLYAAVSKRGPETEYTEAEREIDGIKYSAEIYPGNALYFIPEEVFLFDDDGNLCYYIVTISDSLGEMTYKVNCIDHEPDETLLDISGYEIKESY